MDFTRNELKVLWYLKRHNPLVAAGVGPKHSLITKMGNELDMRNGLVAHILRCLELEKCLIIRTYKRPSQDFSEGGGFNPLMRVELIDPDMFLPSLPVLPLAVVMAKENDELYERTAVEPDLEAVLLALLDRNDQLQAQIDTLVEKLKECQEEELKELQELRQENSRLKNLLTEKKERKVPDHLSHRVRGALPPEVWDNLRHK